MANEMVVLSTSPKDSAGARVVSLAFYVPITTPIPAAGTPTPSAGLGTVEAAAWDVAQKAALDSGDAVAEYMSIGIAAGMTQGQAATYLQNVVYPALAARVNQEYADKYQFTGVTVNAL